ncbi:MAG: hypothetical protein CMC96_05675 [Flavobacteriales bacterium]|nr:hypothetical protein [Flavobacteriales bacterium]|tara:strand:- start:20068 stop:20691 length:624 start_codon:yes stop_codon:yes gene_type:complete
MNKLILIFLLLISFGLQAQKMSFFKLGSAERWWVVSHIFVAKKSKEITQRSIQLSDSVAKAENFPNRQSGGEKDAFRHALWMALLAEEIGVKKALKLGVAHEKKNRKDFEKGRKEEGALPDSVAIEMDLYNNAVGAKISEECTADSILICVKQKLYAGELRIVKMNLKGESLNEYDEPIPRKLWEGNWKNERLLVPSNELLKSQNQN